jgi:hypothetical protein
MDAPGGIWRAGPYTPTAKVISAAVFGGLLAVCCLPGGIGMARPEVRNPLLRYSGGLAQLVHSELEPRVARWADIREFTVSYFEVELPGVREYRQRARGDPSWVISVRAPAGLSEHGYRGWHGTSVCREVGSRRWRRSWLFTLIQMTRCC